MGRIQLTNGVPSWVLESELPVCKASGGLWSLPPSAKDLLKSGAPGPEGRSVEKEDGTAPPFRKSTAACAWAGVATGFVVFFGGWVMDVTALKNVVPGTVVMKASTAAALASLGLSLLLRMRPAPSRLRRIVGVACAVFPLLLGLAFLSEYVLGWDLGIDEFPFVDSVGRAQGIAYPGRLAPTTAVNLVLVGLALLTLDARPLRAWRPPELLVLPVAAVAAMSLIGYTYSIPAFYGPGSAAKMALSTAACFVAIAAGVLLSRPHGRLLTLATTTAPGGMMARRLVPFVVVMPLLLGWLRLEAGDAGVFGDRVGTWWLTAATIVGMLLLLWRGAAQLNVADVARKELESLLSELANHDEMTGLFNRRRFEEEMARHAALVARRGGSTTLMLIDLDRLKEVNDQFGHAVGDAMLRAVSTALKRRIRDADVTARLGGDEFGVLLLDSTPDGAAAVAADLLVAVRAATAGCDGAEEAWSTASIGVAHTTEPLADGGRSLLAQADQAMYEAKRAGGDQVAQFGSVLPSVRPAASRRSSLVVDLRR